MGECLCYPKTVEVLNYELAQWKGGLWVKHVIRSFPIFVSGMPTNWSFQVFFLFYFNNLSISLCWEIVCSKDEDVISHKDTLFSSSVIFCAMLVISAIAEFMDVCRTSSFLSINGISSWDTS